MLSQIIGLGEIGQAVRAVVSGRDRVISYDIDKDIQKSSLISNAEVLHICIPWSDGFVDIVKKYIKRCGDPQHIIIWSTVPIGTTLEVAHRAVHSPVEGRHPSLALSIRKGVRYLGYNIPEEGEFITKYFRDMNLYVKAVPNTRVTEFLKLRSTAKYGINILWTDYEKGVADELGVDFELVKQFDRDYNALYRSLGLDWASRYILDPPGDSIGGHCVIPNAEMLQNHYPAELLELLLEKAPKADKEEDEDESI